MMRIIKILECTDLDQFLKPSFFATMVRLWLLHYAKIELFPINACISFDIVIDSVVISHKSLTSNKSNDFQHFT